MNLVYERADRIMVLEKVGNILSKCTTPASGRCNCSICQQAAEIGSAARYSPRVARILAKGEDMTTNEYKYLIKRGLTQKEIEEETGVTLGKRGQSNEPLTLQKYERLKKRGVKDKEIAQMHGMSDSMLHRWRVVNNVIRIVIKGLDAELYKKLKAQGLTDDEIGARFKTNKERINLWKCQFFSKEEIRSMSQRGMRGRRKTS